MKNKITPWILTPNKYLKPEEAQKLRKHCEDQSILAELKHTLQPVRDWTIIDTALSSGLRAQELCNLKIKHLYLGNSQSSIYVENGKCGKPRLVQISHKLKHHLKKFLQWKKGQGEPTDLDSFLFCSKRSSKITRTAIHKVFKKCLTEAGIDSKYTIHSARHTYGTLLYQKTKDLRLVQKQLGHVTVKTTEIYADVLNEDVKNAVNSLY